MKNKSSVEISFFNAKVALEKAIEAHEANHGGCSSRCADSDVNLGIAWGKMMAAREACEALIGLDATADLSIEAMRAAEAK